MDAVCLAVETLVSAVYVSRATRAFSPADLEKLLERSRKSNQIRGITGMLLYRNGDFMQLIEGPVASIDGLLRTLVRDQRHTGMVVLTKTPIQQRHFSQWQMAFRDLDQTDLKRLPGYSPFMDWSFNAEEFRTKPDLSFKLLTQFKDRLW